MTDVTQTKMVVEGALEGELDGHLSYTRHDPAGRNGGNSRYGYRAKTVITEADLMEIKRAAGSGIQLRPKKVARWQRRLTRRGHGDYPLSARGGPPRPRHSGVMTG
jgi:putative transposase